MATTLPMTNDGARLFTVQTTAGNLAFRSYFATLDGVWFLDIADANGTPICTGIGLLAGTPNLLAGKTAGTALDGYGLEVTTGTGQGERSPEAWGTSALLVLHEPGEAPILTLPDPSENFEW